jgi:hypothetical protein
MLEITGEVHRGHPAAAEFTLDQVAVAESVPELNRNVGHGCGLRW